MSETRTSYAVRAGNPPRIERYHCTITPKRIVMRPIVTGGMGVIHHKDPARYQPCWTEQEAWTRFLTQRRQELTRARAEVAQLERHIAAAEQQIEREP